MRMSLPRPAAAALAAACAACAPWRSDIELTPGIAAAPVLEVQGWRSVPRAPVGRRLTFGPWTATRRPDDAGWSLALRRDSATVGSGRCSTDDATGEPRRKGRWQEVPQGFMACNLVLAASPDTLRLDLKADAGRPLTGSVDSDDWSVDLRGTERLRNRSCLVLRTCGWYLTLDGMDIAAIEADAQAWVYISPDLGGEVRELTALIAAALLLRADPSRFPGGPQRPEAVEP
jgi:hypothetical protein